MRAVTCGAAVVVAVLGTAGPARADVGSLPDTGLEIGTYTQGPSQTPEVETITDLTWQGSWRLGGVAWSGTLHGSHSYASAFGALHLELSGYSSEHVQLSVTCDRPDGVYDGAGDVTEPVPCSFTLGSPVPRQVQLTVQRGIPVTKDVSTDEWKRYRQTITTGGSGSL